MTKRKAIPQKTMKLVLTQCKRRCCLCTGLSDDYDTKKGQIAHIDKDPTNHNLGNLAYLCLFHHDDYDSQSSQSKGLTSIEVIHYRDQLTEYYTSLQPLLGSSTHKKVQQTKSTIIKQQNEPKHVLNSLKTIQNTVSNERNVVDSPSFPEEDSNLTMRLLSDEIATSSELFWEGLWEFGYTLLNTINDIPTSSPILISGGWGSGKSSLMYLLKRRLLEKDQNNVTIEFDAWQYGQENSLLPSLIRCLWDSSKKTVGPTSELFKSTIAVAAALSLKSLPHIIGLGTDDLLKGITKEKLAKEFNATKNMYTAEPPQSETKELTTKFYKLLNELYPNKKIIFFIDNLDKCSPELSLDLLDNIRSLLNEISDCRGNQSINFIVAMDQVTLTKMIANKFTGLDGYESDRYLERLFPFTFRLPSITPADLPRFVLQNIHLIDPKQTRITNQQQELVISRLFEKPFMNPRLIKRSLNKIFLFLKFSNENKELVDETDFLSIYLWILAREKWPKLRKFLLDKPVSFWHELQSALSSGYIIKDVDESSLIDQKGFKDFFRKNIDYDINFVIRKFKTAEKRLSKYGL